MIKIEEIMGQYQTMFPNKEGKICFICGGGECISNATKQDNSIHNKLIKIGNNYCVKFLVPVEYINNTNVGEQIFILVNIMRNNYLETKKEPYDGYLYGYNIPPKLIKSVDLVI